MKIILIDTVIWKSLVEIIYRNRQVSVDVIKSLINEIEKIVRGDEKLA
ncbi:hypothetical protein [Saccharolobus islandicus]|uniref:Uncharacterized protein n=1 Tax=Saccharolobus islandicus LAL14/1 TaxID=1241935 RepID=M9UCR6_SACIS|nr:hypothetical protein [Sulfolobus islandicus]AGJ62336.1 Hypothetical Protein SiL_0882 [Sulfolobus islandicus LAL14/1]